MQKPLAKVVIGGLLTSTLLTLLVLPTMYAWWFKEKGPRPAEDEGPGAEVAHSA